RTHPLGVERLDLVEAHALRLAVVALDEGVDIGDTGEPESVRDDARGLVRAPERARVHALPTAAGEQLGGLTGLLPPRVVERDVGAALDATRRIPFGLAVAYEIELGHGSSARAVLARRIETTEAARPLQPRGERAEHLGGSRVDLEARASISPCLPAVHDDDRHATPRRLIEQSDAGVHHERGSRDEQRLGTDDEGARGREHGRGNELAE